ncbi:MAG: transglycosylase SLT domain-containing protein [Betaproteobacteria bacterium]|jgi:soluble lytic murein transglycosylase|nr:transglycosylase SLT domain-containing protein [Rubrivivax sp.]
MSRPTPPLGRFLLCTGAALLALGTTAVGAQAPRGGAGVLAAGTDDTLLQAREALRRKDQAALAAAAASLQRARHPLAQWADYWALTNRLVEARQADLDAFYARWPGTYVEDRLRNDWLLELGARRDWANFRVEFPRFRMNDDREVTCYALLTQHEDGVDVRAAAQAAWLAQRELDDGCQLLAGTLRAAGRLSDGDVWAKARAAAEANRPRALRAAVALIDPALERHAAELWENPQRWLERTARPAAPQSFELELLALMRLAATDPDAAAAQLTALAPPADAGRARLPLGHQALAWAQVARQSGLRLQPQALDHALRAWAAWDAAARPGTPAPFSAEALAWQVRAALRAPESDSRRWPLVQRAIDAMAPAERADEAWAYWRARAVLAQAAPGPAGEAARQGAREALQALAPRLSFYGKLATEELGREIVPPPPPAPLTEAEQAAARQRPGLERALQLIALGLRSEGVREWNFTLRGMADRELLAAAEMACAREVWDRCINTSDRTRAEVDLRQRFPTPFRSQVVAQARRTGLDPAVVYGLIRQESRFIMDARSHVGASGLMQLMPATARWTARQVGLTWSPAMINDRDVNLLLGNTYLKRVLEDFGGSLAMATAAYNAGPGRPRRWREGASVEAAAWAEGIPFNETRDYVKKVLSNSVYYAAVLGQPVPSIRALLGPPIAPRPPGEPAPNRDIP